MTRNLTCTCVCLMLACTTRSTTSSSDEDAGVRVPPAVCAAWGTTDPLSLDELRFAYRWSETRRHLRMLEAMEPGHFLRMTAAAVPQDAMERGQVCPDVIYQAGRLLFEHDFNRDEGLGNATEPNTRASRFHRVHHGPFGGPDTTACLSCHWRGGIAGAGSVLDNSYILGDGEHISSADARNPPSLAGAGVAQLIAQEMTAQLQAQRDGAVSQARGSGTEATVVLEANGIGFGVLSAQPDGQLNTAGVDGVDADLVVRPFGWKGTAATLHEFITESLQLHLGMQTPSLLKRYSGHPEFVGTGTNPADPDGDGVTDELSEGQLTALAAFVGMQDVPQVIPEEMLPELGPPAAKLRPPTQHDYTDQWNHGRVLLGEMGCTACHVPMMVVKDPVLRIHSPTTGGVVEIDLSVHSQWPRLAYDAQVAGYPVWVFGDFKRHDLGESNAAQYPDHGVAREKYLTRRLMGLAGSPPYFHDGRAPSLDLAIAAHAGEAEGPRDNFAALNAEDKAAVRLFLLSLRRQRRIILP